MKKQQKYVLAAAILIAASLIICILIFMNRGIELFSVDDVKNELKGYSFSTHDNLTFKCDVPKIETDKLYNITMEAPTAPTDATEQRLRKLMSLITSQDISNVPAVKLMNDMTNTPYSVTLDLSGDSGKVGPWGELYENSNTFVCRNISGYNEDDIDLQAPNEVVDIADNDTLNKGVKLVSGDTVSIAQADKYISNVLKLFADNGFFNNNESFRLTSASIQDNDGKKAIILQYEHIFEGLSVDRSGFIDADPNGTKGEIRPSYINAIVTGEEEFAYLGNLYYYMPKGDSDKAYKEVKKIVPLSTAEDIVAKGLAQNLKYDVSEVALKYCCYLKDTDGEFTYRPMWCFILEEKTNGIGFANYFPAISAYVDAVSGDLYYCDSGAMTLDIMEYKK